MTELLKSSRDAVSFDGYIPTKGNMDIGFFRSEKVAMVDKYIISLKGPPIAIYHPLQYDTARYRCDSGGETTKFGIVGIYNVDRDLWITSYITKVDSSRTTIRMDGTGTAVNEEVMVYYYAESPGIGCGKSLIQGDCITPDCIDTLIKALNDAHPHIFSNINDGSPSFRFQTDLATNSINQSYTADTWYTLLDYSGTGTFRFDDFPVYITDVLIKFSHAWDYMDIRITIDGTVLTNGFNDVSTDYIRWLSLDPADFPSGSSHARHPGKMFGDSDEPLFYDLMLDVSGNKVIPIGFIGESVSDIKIEVRIPDTYTDTVACYVSGWYIPS
jgi:hypothetical protein